MALAATFAAHGMRPASFLPAIKCSSCGEEIEIAAMGDHICSKAPPSPRSQPASLTNAFTIRQMNAHGHMPHAPSPLQQQQQQQNKPVSLPKTRVRAPTVTSHQLPAPKAIRPPPPHINAEAANMPFLAPRPPRSDSPLSPALSVRSGSSQGSRPAPPLRSMTSPMPRGFDPRPPSPEMSGNLDCAFPPFMPASGGGGSRPGTSSGRKMSVASERGGSRGREGRPIGNSGESAAGQNDIMKSGPFDPNRRPSDQAGIAQSSDRRRPSMSSIKLGQAPPPIPDEPIPRPSTSHSTPISSSRPSTANGVGSGSDGHQKQNRGPPPRPERPAENVLAPRFLDKMSAEPAAALPSTLSHSQPPMAVRGSDRSRTSPRRQESDGIDHSLDLHKTPSEPHTRQRDPRPALGAFTKSEGSQIPQVTSRQQSQSRNARGTDHRPQDVPPVPRPVQQHRQEKSHTPSGSGSSVASSAPSLGNSNSSSGRSPVTSSAASSVDALSLLTIEPRHYGDEARMRVPGLNVNPQKPGMRAELPASRSPPRTFTRPAPPKDIVAPPRSPTLPALISPPLESPMDPALQGRQIPGRSATEPWRPSAAPGPARPTISRTKTMPEARVMEPARAPAPPVPTLSVPGPSDKDYDPYRPTSPAPATRSRSKSNAAPAQFKAYAPPPLPPPPTQNLAPTQYKPSSPGSSLRPHSPQPISAPPPPAPQAHPRPAPTPLTRRPTTTTTTTKPTCRGCRHPIAGKSVKAADGRLTGRWHKPCFRCVTCAQPFTTADFYVFGNEPYCEQHYHEANGSLCEGCGGGIEGGYLGTCSSSSGSGGGGGGVVVDRKFHPGCFRCCECRVVLAEDYFEIGGRVFCERDALAAMRGLVGKKTEVPGQAKGKGVGVGGGLSVPDRKALTAERRTTRLMMM
ncbi:hypothetical protein LTR91_012734 [Friedmanniomyces endolithicus]|uniref:LIM zinc-binding domain-containing protein n=1 Tax=Friedmanniomyces endolithicus TaxID=329885 RepID=A0AAN6KEY6_9PEZI|nr:hypothetical protein LTR57_018757 [Friedmanniomyces endolithicus]KAK0964254.1 hypothetical protein LTS01_018928 [Friedmanniomyces endolithicus]KAK0979135.1 hypothetical protein LTR91_012734 [Friedmanniomyces endolithicus]KAK1032642.1 hypothetical protein LTS16_016998 [Friedmanniomyces endolithicus]